MQFFVRWFTNRVMHQLLYFCKKNINILCKRCARLKSRFESIRWSWHELKVLLLLRFSHYRDSMVLVRYAQNRTYIECMHRWSNANCDFQNKWKKRVNCSDTAPCMTQVKCNCLWKYFFFVCGFRSVKQKIWKYLNFCWCCCCFFIAHMECVLNIHL